MLETRLHLLVVPGAAANSLGRAADGSLRVRVAAPAREGKANRELVRYLADLLGLPKTAVRVDRGEGARHKVIVVSGLDPDAVRQRLEAAGAG